MEAELEGMIVGGWVQGDRARLLLRVEALERELSLMASGRHLEREASDTQRASFKRRLVKTEKLHSGVVKELSLRADGEEKLRRICQSRVQELEGEVSLLSEQLRAAEAKFRETEKALQRERAHNASRRSFLRSSAERSKECECASAPADQRRQKGRDRHAAVDNKPFVSTSCSDGSRYFDAPAYEGDDCTAALRGGTPEDAGELRAVESLMAGLLEENLRLKSATLPLQDTSRKTSPLAVSAAHLLSDGAGGGGKGRQFEQSEAARGDTRPAEGAACVDTAQDGDASTNTARGMSPDAVPVALTGVTPPEIPEERDSRTEGGSQKAKEAGFGKGVMVDESNIDIATALQKIQALTGMIRTQEEIEKLLGQELGELKHEAEDRERLWRVLLRWKGVLEAKGYATERDIRAADLLTQFEERVMGEDRSSRDKHRLTG